MTEKLKPCPFCGGEAKKGKGLPSEQWVYCHACGLNTRTYKTEQEAVAAWNTRPLEDAKDAEIKRLREALSFYATMDDDSINYLTIKGDLVCCEIIDNEDGVSFQKIGETAREALKC